jgi:tartrate dehydrogenase/decarboxylase/D-malate dehydrogenase
MKEYNIAVIPGDGIGNEVMPEGIKVLEAIAKLFGEFRMRLEHFPWGCDYYLKTGRMMPVEGLKILQAFDAIYFGAVGYPSVPDPISLRGLRLDICQSFDQYVNLRPSHLLPGVKSPLRDKSPGDVDFVVVRENTEGEYTGAGGRSHPGSPAEVAVQTAIFTRSGVERIIRYSFELARNRRKKLSSVSKSNAQEYIFGLWDDITIQVSKDYPDVVVERVLVDAMAARMVLKPESLDVIVGSNLHADILTDLAGAICGSLGVAPSGNINPERTFPSMFEPIHGSAVDIYGKGIANPIAMIWSGAMMLAHLGHPKSADLIVRAIQTTTAGGILTPDLGGNARTSQVGDSIVNVLHQMAEQTPNKPG